MSSPSATSPDNPPPRPRGFRFTIRQMMLLVLLSSVTCSALLPVVRANRNRIFETILFEMILLPTIWAGFVLVFVRRGPLQNWLVRGIFLLPVLLGALAILAMSLALVYVYHDRALALILALFLAGIVDAVIVSSVWRWVSQLIPIRCPSCRSLTLISDTGTGRLILRGLKATRWCWNCRTRFGRQAKGTWNRTA